MTRGVLAAVLIGVSTLSGSEASSQWRPGGQMRIVLLVDSSSAMSSMLTDFRAALHNFLDALPEDPQPEIVIVTTGRQLRVRAGPTVDRAKLQAAASGFAPDGGGNAFLDSLLEADQRFLKNAPDRRSVFVILTTDAGATLGDARIDIYNRFVDDFLARGGRAHAIVIRGVNSGVTTQIAENLTRNTGGFCETVGISNAAPKLMKSLAEYVAAEQ
jgi:hypothetical protein